MGFQTFNSAYLLNLTFLTTAVVHQFSCSFDQNRPLCGNIILHFRNNSVISTYPGVHNVQALSISANRNASFISSIT